MLEHLKKGFIKQIPIILYLLFLILIPASIIRVNASIPGYERFFLFRILLFLILVILFLTFLFKRKKFLVGFSNLKKEKYAFGLFIVWLLVSALSFFWIADFEKYFRYNVLLAISISFVFVIIFFVRDKLILKRVWKILLITFVAAVVVALIEKIFGIRLAGSAFFNAQNNLPFVTSFFHHPNDFASYISLSLPFFTLLPIYKGYSRYKWWVFIIVAITAFVLTFTGSKINYIATIVSLFLVLVILIKEHVRQLPAYLTIAVLALFSFFPALGPQIEVKAIKIFNESINEKPYSRIGDGAKLDGAVSEFTEGYGSVTVRKNLITNSYKIIKENPKAFFIGVGAGQVEEYMVEFKNTDGVTNLHNWWLEVLVDHGIFIGLGYVLLYLWLLREIYKKAIKTKDNFLRYISYSSVVILVVFAFTSISPSSSVGFAPLWLTLGLAISIKNIE